MDHFESDKLYILEGNTLNALYRIADRLGSGERLSDDQRRDIMNFMVARLDGAIETAA